MTKSFFDKKIEEHPTIYDFVSCMLHGTYDETTKEIREKIDKIRQEGILKLEKSTCITKSITIAYEEENKNFKWDERWVRLSKVKEIFGEAEK